MIGEILGESRPLPQVRKPDAILVRQFFDHLLVKDPQGWHDCQNGNTPRQDAVCNDARAIQDKLTAIRQDIIAGHAYYVAATSSNAVLPSTKQMEIVRTHESCEFEIKEWGPQQGKASKGFNLQPDGSNALWFVMKKLRGKPEVHLGDSIGTTIVGDKMVIGSFAQDTFLAKPAQIPVKISCPGKKPVIAGNLDLH